MFFFLFVWKNPPVHGHWRPKLFHRSVSCIWYADHGNECRRIVCSQQDLNDDIKRRLFKRLFTLDVLLTVSRQLLADLRREIFYFPPPSSPAAETAMDRWAVELIFKWWKSFTVDLMRLDREIFSIEAHQRMMAFLHGLSMMMMLQAFTNLFLSVPRPPPIPTDTLLVVDCDGPCEYFLKDPAARWGNKE